MLPPRTSRRESLALSGPPFRIHPCQGVPETEFFLKLCAGGVEILAAVIHRALLPLNVEERAFKASGNNVRPTVLLRGHLWCTPKTTPVAPRGTPFIVKHRVKQNWEYPFTKTGSTSSLLKNFRMEYLTLKQAADRLGVTKKKVYRAVSNGHLEATEGTWRGQTALKVSSEHLEKWAQEWLEHPKDTPVSPPSHPAATPEAPQEYTEATPVLEVEHSVPPQGYSVGPPPEAYVAMLERVALAERRAVELEFEMRKHRLLLAENAESFHEREAKLSAQHCANGK